MKILFPIVCLVIAFCGCSERRWENTSNISKQPKNSYCDSHGNVWEIMEIDNCEYLFNEFNREPVITHKGNCKNPIHYGEKK